MDKDLEKVILKDPTEPALSIQFRSKGFTTMKEDAILKSLLRLFHSKR